MILSFSGTVAQPADSNYQQTYELALQTEISPQIIFSAIENGINVGKVDMFSNYFGARVNINLPTGEIGYFSANQTYYILKNYLDVRKALGFSFTTLGETEKIPFATGRAVFRYKGNREYIQVYVALIKFNGNWFIGTINLY